MSRIETPLNAVLRGALAGLAGGIAIMLSMQLAEQLMPSPPSPPEGPPPEQPREKLVRKVSERVFEEKLPAEQVGSLAQALHWAYSASWGMVYGILQPSLRLPEWLGGMILGTVVWVFGPVTLLPRMKLEPPPEAMPISMVIMGWIFHVIFGLKVAYVYRFLASYPNCGYRR